MNPVAVIEQFYAPGTKVHEILMNHSIIVRQKSLEIARTIAHLNPDLEFISRAAMLHDIGICLTHAPSIGCNGSYPYVCHGYLGRKLLDENGLPPEYGLVCERHTGAGITRANIVSHDLPLPHRDMVPVTLEEKIICAADKYHSKSPKKPGHIPTTEEIIKNLEKIGIDHAQRFAAWAEEFNL
jgi:uncharacterized protein